MLLALLVSTKETKSVCLVIILVLLVQVQQILSALLASSSLTCTKTHAISHAQQARMSMKLRNPA